MFDENRFQYFEAIIMLEIHNVIDKKDREELIKKIGEIKMTPQAESMVKDRIIEINDKLLNEKKEEGIEEGLEKGLERGMEKGREEGIAEVASNFKDILSDEDIAKRTGLSIEEVQKL